VCRAPVPEWARCGLAALPDELATGIRRGNDLERANVDLVEAVLLEPFVGRTFPGVVVDRHPKGGGTVQVSEPAVLARCGGGRLRLGAVLDVRLVVADPRTRTVRFEPAGRIDYPGATADEPAGRPRRVGETPPAEERPGSTGQGGG